MDVRLQSKLLRAIQERVIDRVGGTKPVPVDIRIIATSNRNLADAVREGTFREDLLFRLNVVNLKIPPLRERPADILELAQHFAKKYAEANGVPLRPISADARRVLTANRWQGNVRELENTMHRAVLMAQGDEIGADAILTPDGDRLDLAKTAPAVAHATFAAEQVTRALVGRTVADVERDLILETLKHCLGNRTHAANILGISIRTLRNKLNEYADGGVPITPAGAGDYSALCGGGVVSLSFRGDAKHRTRRVLGPLEWRLFAAFVLIGIGAVAPLAALAVASVRSQTSGLVTSQRDQARHDIVAALAGAYARAGSWAGADLAGAQALA